MLQHWHSLSSVTRLAPTSSLLAVAAQQGLLPVGVAAIERAVELNGVALAFNLRAFRLGRLFAADPERVRSLVPRRIEEPALSLTLGELVAHRAAHLCDYQDERLAERRTFDGGRIAFNMAPPILPSGHKNGRPKKREIGV